MKTISILFGLVLTGLGVMNYAATGAESLWSLFPALLGLLAILFGFLQGRWEHKHALYGVVMMAILTLLASLRGIWELFTLVSGGQPTYSRDLIWIQAGRGLLSLLFIGLAIVLVNRFWHHWKAFGQFMGDWLGRVVLTVFYFTVFVPFGLGVRWFGDPLKTKDHPDRLWRPRTTGDQSLEDISRQY